MPHSSSGASPFTCATGLFALSGHLKNMARFPLIDAVLRAALQHHASNMKEYLELA